MVFAKNNFSKVRTFNGKVYFIDPPLMQYLKQPPSNNMDLHLISIQTLMRTLVSGGELLKSGRYDYNKLIGGINLLKDQRKI